MSVRLNHRGATIPLTVIVIAVMAVAVAITYHRLSSEHNITGDAQAQVDAFAVAQSGLNSYLAGLGSASGGSARVTMLRLKDSVTTTSPIPAVYIITSRGGGTITSNGNGTINGAVITGLNVKLGIAVPQTAIANGNKTFQYDSCNLTRALGHVGSIQRIRNG